MSISINQIKDAFDFLEDKWFSFIGLLSGLLIYLIVIGLFATITSLSDITALIVILIGFIFISIIWTYTNFHIPRTKKGKIGFLISIRCESKETHLRIKQDFLDTLHSLIKDSVTGKYFQFIELPQHQAKKVIDFEDSLRIRLKSKCHYILYGRIRERLIDGKENYFLELDGYVTHKPVPIDVSREFGEEFGLLLPRRLQIPRHNDTYTFQFTSEWISVVSKYIIAVAALMSGDLDFSLELFNDLDKYFISKRTTEFRAISKIKVRVPEYIGSIYLTKASIDYSIWAKNKNDPNLINSIEKNLYHVPNIYQDKISFYTLSSIVKFLKYKDIDASIHCLNKIRNKDYLWYFNSAFLYAYYGNIKKAIQLYRKAIKLNLEPEKIIEVEEFIFWILENEADKYQLYYCLGFYNWKIKCDLNQARNDFQKFIDACEVGKYKKEKDLALSWINTINNELSKI